MTTAAPRPFGYWTATALVMGGMIGSGIFLMPIALAPYGWTGVAGWIVSIAGAIAIGWTLARLAQAMPEATGAIAITGAVLGPLPGVMVGVAYWVSVWATNAAIAMAATSYLAAFVPALDATPLIGALVSVALIWLFTLLNLAGATLAGRVQVVTTILKIAPLIAVVAIAAAVGGSGMVALPSLPAPGTMLAGLGGAVALTLFPLLGFEAASVTAERIRDPARNVPRATMTGTIAVGLFYILVCSSIVLLLPAADVAASTAPFQLFVERFAGVGGGLLVAAFAAIAALGALNGWVLIQGEVPLGMARAGLLPRWFAQVSARDVPVRVLILSSTCASLLVLSNASASLAGAFAFVALLTTCSSLWFYLAACVAALVRRIAPVTATLGIAFALFAFWGAGSAASGLSLVLMLAALPLYWLRPRTALAEQPA
ncbi:amino acid permease [Sphingomonas sp.]|uniref:amino acid permease n=1 Tax=Sphingomonas sp. TaxID=28214 RepID=UPI00334088EF